MSAGSRRRLRTVGWPAAVFVALAACDPGAAPEPAAAVAAGGAAAGTDGLPAPTQRVTYTGAKLVERMNGGVELYLEYGLVSLVEERYVRSDAAGVTLRRYEYETPLGAYGKLMDPEIDGSESPAGVGDRGFAFGGGGAAPELLFQRGRTVIELKPEGADEGLAALVRRLAERENAAAAPGAPLPDWIAALDPSAAPVPSAGSGQAPSLSRDSGQAFAGRTSEPIRVFMGPVGLEGYSPAFDPAWWAPAKEAPLALATYRGAGNATWVALRQRLPSEEAALAALTALRAALLGAGYRPALPGHEAVAPPTDALPAGTTAAVNEAPGPAHAAVTGRSGALLWAVFGPEYDDGLWALARRIAGAADR